VERQAIKIEGFAEVGRTFGECRYYRIKLNGIDAAVVPAREEPISSRADRGNCAERWGLKTAILLESKTKIVISSLTSETIIR